MSTSESDTSDDEDIWDQIWHQMQEVREYPENFDNLIVSRNIKTILRLLEQPDLHATQHRCNESIYFVFQCYYETGRMDYLPILHSVIKIFFDRDLSLSLKRFHKILFYNPIKAARLQTASKSMQNVVYVMFHTLDAIIQDYIGEDSECQLAMYVYTDIMSIIQRYEQKHKQTNFLTEPNLLAILGLTEGTDSTDSNDEIVKRFVNLLRVHMTDRHPEQRNILLDSLYAGCFQDYNDAEHDPHSVYRRIC